MTERKIRLRSLDDANAFVIDASRCDYDVRLTYGDKNIDAKSLLGILSLDLTKVLTVLYGAPADPAFDRKLDRFAA